MIRAIAPVSHSGRRLSRSGHAALRERIIPRHSWRETARQFAEARYYVVNLDLRGHGNSEWSPQGRYALGSLVADVKEVIAGLSAKVSDRTIASRERLVLYGGVARQK